MALPILTTKFYIPPLRGNIVHRLHLIERLDEGLRRTRRVTLVSAPAGFGKTTLLSEWVSGRGQPVAWFSLDEEDNDPTRFWSHFIAALQRIVPDLGEGALLALQSPQPPPIESILASLLNEIAAIPHDLILVLDDYHAFDSKPVDAALAFLIERLSPRMHLVITSREDPDLPLARWRARDQLVELRDKDLRFSELEAAEFLNQTMGLHLPPEDITALETRTEGWIAGLQLAALSMQGLEDTAGFIRSFTGSHRFVLDYLLEEVLHKQTQAIQTFLLQTAILERMCAPLCDVVLLDASIKGQEMLETLERANLFIISLDNERRWYRYHHLFAELLRTRLARTFPDQIAELHRRASDWYAGNKFFYEAITHAITARDWTRAAEIMERLDELRLSGETSTRLGWFEAFPPQVLHDRPRLGLAFAWALFMSNQSDRAEQQLDQLTPLVQETPSLLGEMYVIRMMVAARRFDSPAFYALAQQALSRVPPEEASPRCRILITLGVAYEEMSGDIAAAKNAFREAYELSETSPSISVVGNAPLPLIALAYLADYECLEGHLRSAARMYEQAIELAEKWGGQSSLALCFVQQGRAGLLYEWNDLEGAASALQECFRIGDWWKSPRLLVPAYGLSALLKQARGQVEEANVWIHRAEQAARDPYSSPYDMGMLALYQISLWIAQEDFRAIEQWERDHDSEWRLQTGRARDALTIILARARIALYHGTHDDSCLKQARALIEPALEHAQTSGLKLNVMRLLLLDALALSAQRETNSAITTLKQALALAGPENYIRSFLDLGKPMQELLSWSLEGKALDELHQRAYVGKLLSQFDTNGSVEIKQPTGDTLIEPLSQRELDVLRLIAKGLSNREIGERLFLALSTVKGHTRVIFDKLQVQRRTEAVARARELGLL
ncbi:MAG TPA: LuxR C-terminal-related transcriptional regulator [Anaerolineales bacterium]|nr:LuxR C-terminal-related transcriptional regulator [Anaerolineales bacterium]